MMRAVSVALVLFLDLLSVPGGEGSSSCKHPKGLNGESYTDGCLKITCKASVWRSSMDGSLCCYDRKPYQKNTTITSTVTEDGCIKATIGCGGDGDMAMMILHTENYCEDHSKVEQVAEIKQLSVENMDRKGCVKDSKKNATEDLPTEESPLMFLGPGESSGLSEVFSLPTQSSGLISANCTVPTFPATDIDIHIDMVVGFVHDGYLQICGGSILWVEQSSCYQLKESAWVATTPLMVPRHDAASVLLQDGSVLVSGGYMHDRNTYLKSSEVLTASALSWSASIELPSARNSHCMLQLTTGQLFLHGGYNRSEHSGETHISMDMMSPWVTKASSQNNRSNHACEEFGGYIWIGGGQKDATTEKYELNTNSWTYGPDLPNYSYWPGEFLSYAGMLTYAGGYENKNIYQLNKEQNGWIKIGEMSQSRRFFPALSISENVCRGVKQVTPAPSERKNGQD